MNETAGYKIKLEKFEGPLDLLLELIENEKLTITEFSIAKVCDQFLTYISGEENIGPSSLADFLLVAAQLILIKSKAILPNFELSEEEKVSAEELAFRLREYKKFKDAAKTLRAMYFNKKSSFEKQWQGTTIAFYPGKNLTSDALNSAFCDLAQILKTFEALKKETIKETISLKKKISEMQTMISRQVNMRFNEIIKQAKNKLEAIISFLALLELVKQKIVHVNQMGEFGDIEIAKNQAQILNQL